MNTNSSASSSHGFLNRDCIKLAAIITMTLNHIAQALLPSGSVLSQSWISIGHFTAITMIWFLVEGFDYTHDRAAYGKRLLLFGILSQVPFRLAMTEGDKIIESGDFNMILSLFLCFCLLTVLDSPRLTSEKVILTIVIFAASSWCDWFWLAPLYTLLFYRARRGKIRWRTAWLTALCAFPAYGIIVSVILRTFLSSALLSAAGTLCAQTAAMLVIRLCYNGKRAASCRPFLKWFFYWYYPLHLLVIGLFRILWR